MRDEPLQRDVDVVLLLAGDGVTADLPVLDGVQVHLLDEAVFVEGAGKVALVAQHQDRDAGQLQVKGAKFSNMTKTFHATAMNTPEAFRGGCGARFVRPRSCPGRRRRPCRRSR